MSSFFSLTPANISMAYAKYRANVYKVKLALPLQRNFHRRMNDEQKLIRTFVVERTD